MPTEKGLRKAAILFLFLGEDLSSEIFRKLEDHEIQTISNYIAQMDDLQPEEVKQTLTEFCEQADTDFTLPTSKGKDFIKNVIIKALGEKKAATILDEVLTSSFYTTQKSRGLRSVKGRDPKTIATILQDEHPQVIALILAHMEPERAGIVIGHLPENIRVDVILRIANLSGISPDIVDEVDDILQKKLDAIGGGESRRIGGLRPAAEILNQMEKVAGDSILEKITEVNPTLAEEIKQMMFTFEDIRYLDDRSIQTLLKEIDPKELAMALKTASSEIKLKIFKNMSGRAADMLKDDIETMGPVRLKDVEKAQLAIANVARKLEIEGKIVLSRGEEDVLV